MARQWTSPFTGHAFTALGVLSKVCVEGSIPSSGDHDACPFVSRVIGERNSKVKVSGRLG